MVVGRHRVAMYTIGPPTRFEFVPMIHVDKYTYRICRNSMSLWPRTSVVTAYMHKRGVQEPVRPAEVDPLFGEIKLHDTETAYAVTTAGSYYPRQIVAKAERYMIEQSTISTKSGRVPYMRLSLDDVFQVEDTFFEKLYGDTPLFIEIFTGKNESMRGWFELENNLADVKSPMSLRFVPHWLCGVSYGWNRIIWDS